MYIKYSLLFYFYHECPFCFFFFRSLLLAELEKEEKEKDWYYAQLQNLTKRIDSFPLTENVSRCHQFFFSGSVLSRRCISTDLS